MECCESLVHLLEDSGLGFRLGATSKISMLVKHPRPALDMGNDPQLDDRMIFEKSIKSLDIPTGLQSCSSNRIRATFGQSASYPHFIRNDGY